MILVIDTTNVREDILEELKLAALAIIEDKKIAKDRFFDIEIHDKGFFIPLPNAEAHSRRDENPNKQQPFNAVE